MTMSISEARAWEHLHSEPAWTEIVPGLFIGNYNCTLKRECLRDNNITAVVTLLRLEPHHYRWRMSRFTDYIHPDCHLLVSCVDTSTQDLLKNMTRICDFIENHLDRQTDTTPTASPPKKNVIVYCMLGISVAPTMVAAFLMRKLQKSRDEVLADVKAKWPRADPNANFLEQLEIWEQVEYEIWADEAEEVPKPQYQAFLSARAARREAIRRQYGTIAVYGQEKKLPSWR